MKKWLFLGLALFAGLALVYVTWLTPFSYQPGVFVVHAQTGNQTIPGAGAGTGTGLSGLVATIACGTNTNCVNWVENDSTDNCGTSTTAWLAAINGYAGAGIPQVTIQSGGGKAFKFLTAGCHLEFDIPVSLYLYANIDCAQAATTANCIQIGPSNLVGLIAAQLPKYSIQGQGVLLGGANLTNGGIEVEPYVAAFNLDSPSFINFGAGNGTLGNCTNYALLFDAPVNTGTVSNTEYTITDNTAGRCAYGNPLGNTTGQNTILFHHNTMSGTNVAGSICSSIGILDGGSYSDMLDNNIYGFAMDVRLQGIGHRIDDNQFDSAGCVPTTSGVNAAIQIGASGAATPVNSVTIANNQQQFGTGHLTYLMAIAGDSTGTLNNTSVVGNQSAIVSGVLINGTIAPPGMACAGCTFSGNTNMIPPLGNGWVGQPISSADNFTRADATNLGNGWNQLSLGVLGIHSNTATPTTATANQAAYVYGAASSSPDQFSQATIAAIAASANDGEGVVVRSSSPSGSTLTEYQYQCFNSTRLLFRWVASVTTQLGPTVSSACTTGDVLRLEVSGQNPAVLTAYYNGVPDITFADTAGTVTTGLPGVHIFNNSTVNNDELSNWSGGPLVPSTTTTARGVPQKATVNAADYTNATTGFTNILGVGSGAGLAFGVAPKTSYTMHCSLVWSASAATAGPQFEITGPSTPTSLAINMTSAITATTTASAAATAFSAALNPVGATVTSGANEMAVVDMNLVNGANAGTVQLQAAAQGTGTLTIRKGSSCTMQ